jgi:hypothetical protein
MQESPDRGSDEVLDIILAGSKIKGVDQMNLLFYLCLRLKTTNTFNPAVNIASPKAKSQTDSYWFRRKSPRMEYVACFLRFQR